MAALPARRALLDGEVVAFGDDGRPDFDLLRGRALASRGSRDPDTDVRMLLRHARERADSAYVAGRTDCWRKIKIEETADFVVIGIAVPSDATFGRRSFILAVAADAGVRYVGRVAVSGAERAALDGVLSQLRRNTAPCRGAGRAEVWLEPWVVAEVRFLASRQRGLRHAIFVRFRPDKTWRECAGPTE